MVMMMSRALSAPSRGRRMEGRASLGLRRALSRDRAVPANTARSLAVQSAPGTKALG